MSYSNDQIAATTIGVSIVFLVGMFMLYIGYYKSSNVFTASTPFYVKKWLYVGTIICLNAAGCVLVYYTQSLQVILYIILVLKSKDLVMSLVFVFNMMYKHLSSAFVKPTVNLTDEIRRIVAFVPVYNETLDQLTRTVDSVLENTTVPNYVMTFIVSDGKNSYKDIMDNILVSGYGLCYKAWNGQDVSVNVLYGTRGGRHITLLEKGHNVGKKDSIILMNNLFNAERDDLDVTNKHFKEDVMNNIRTIFGVAEFDYMFATDADTIIDSDTILCLLDSIKKRNAVASCGMVNVDKSTGSWFWNNLQNYQYLYGQYVRRTCEDLFDQVLCLPGCVSMFRLHSSTVDAQKLYSAIPDDNNMIVSSVQYVGTDRRYTGSLLYSGERVVMDMRCNAYTLPPQSFTEYVSQRRRWTQNAYFNTMINIVAPRINFVLRLFNLVDLFRMSLVYFRLFNTVYFVYLLSSRYNPTEILELVPYIVVLVYPTVFFFVYCLFNWSLLTQWLELFLFFLLNKFFILVSNVVIFTIMLWNIGVQSWSNHTELQNVVVQTEVEEN
jgi:cellulose synthase/poly-beta-1,6-N-acetylglucosamine synthase-like glycosyltransferase